MKCFDDEGNLKNGFHSVSEATMMSSNYNLKFYVETLTVIFEKEYTNLIEILLEKWLN